MRPPSRISCHGQGSRLGPKKSFHGQEPISKMQSISNKRTTMAHMRNEYPRHKQRTSARPLARLGSSRITAKRFRRIIIESVSVFSNLLPLTHLRRKLTTSRAVPHQLQHVIACSALRRERTPRLRSQRRQGQPWPSLRACATAARKECPAQSRGNRTSGPHL